MNRIEVAKKIEALIKEIEPRMLTDELKDISNETPDQKMTRDVSSVLCTLLGTLYGYNEAELSAITSDFSRKEIARIRQSQLLNAMKRFAQDDKENSKN